MIIQKELKETSPKGTDDFIREVDVLSFLNCLKHPNIVELPIHLEVTTICFSRLLLAILVNYLVEKKLHILCKVNTTPCLL